MNTRTKHSRAKPAKPVTSVDVQEFITVHMMFEGDEKTGWVHTHGMWEVFKLPDLEIVGVAPRFLMLPAGSMLNFIAQYMIDAKFEMNGARTPKIGETMGVGHGVVIKFEESKPLHPDDKEENEGHYTNPRWRVVEVPEMFKCHGCDNPAHAHNKPVDKKEMQ